MKNIENSINIPSAIDISELSINLHSRQYLGTLNDYDCYAGEITNMSSLPSDVSFHDVRRLHSILPDDIFFTACRALTLVDWDVTHIFCSKCGLQLTQKDDERAEICTHCNIYYYPKIFPAIIVAVVKDNCLLLARDVRFPKKFYSVIAGFVEINETLEEAVQREVLEETHLNIKNITYFGSQPQPFSNSLMVAFTAEYNSGEIIVDNNELIEAVWYTAHNLPECPPQSSIAGRLIEWFISTFG